MLLLSRHAPMWLVAPIRRRLAPAPVNQPPVANPDNATVSVNTATLIPVRANDTDPEGGALTLVSAATATGSAVVQSGQILYTPPNNFAGAATLTYVVADPQGNTATGTVSVTVVWPQPTFTAQPSFGAASYSVGDVLAINLGAAGPNATLSVEAFALGAASRTAELTGTGSTRSWDSTGETEGTISLRVRATNPSGFVLSNAVTVPLAAASAPLLLRVVDTDQVYQGDGGGSINVVLTNTPGATGTYALAVDDLAGGPRLLQAHTLVNVTRPGQNPATGDEIGFVPGSSLNFLAAFDDTLSAPVGSWRWQRDTGGNGVGVDIPGSTPTRVVLGTDGGHRLRLIRRLVQGANILDIPSAWTAIVPGTVMITATGFTDGILLDGNTVVATAATDGILVSEV